MAISSIHIEAGQGGVFLHNSRERETENSIFDDEISYCSCDSKTAFESYRKEIKERTDQYLKHHPTRTKLHSKTITHLSAIVNFNQDHTPEDIQNVCEHLEKLFDTKVIQYAMHRDEGHISDDGEKIKNYHAHIEFMGLDSQGSSVRRKMDKKTLSNLQTDVALILGMKRGKNYIGTQEKRPKRLDTYEFKEMKQKESAAKLAKQKDLKDEIKALKDELRSMKAERSDYALVEQLNKDLKQQIKEKDLTIDQLQEQLSNYKVINSLQRDEIKDLKGKLDTLENRNKANLGLNQDLKQEIKDLKQQIKDKQSLSESMRNRAKMDDHEKELERQRK